ncbi:MAG: methionine--tRNA ligase [Vicinamibacteria bacterium]
MTTRISYHTTPIYYVNDVPHPGHAYSTLATDALTRARRLMGQEVFFLTGTDEHGQNIERIAREKGLDAQAYCDRIAEVFKALWQRLEIRYDGFIRTTDELHTRGVLRFWQRLREARTLSGESAIYSGKYAGWYCPRCEGFKTEAELRQPDNVCPDHERPCEWTEEENFFFRLSGFEGWLRDEIGSGRLLIEPAGRRNEVLAVVEQGLQDFSVSRARVKWGIPVPEDPSHVFYVWMDALANYITALDYAGDGPAYRRYWEGAARDGESAAPPIERLHLVGKEIIRFHCLYWPAMLKAAGLPVPTRVFAHGHLTKNGKRLSKTTGNTIDPNALLDWLGVDAFRYFFLREGSFSQDWDFTESAYVGRYNADLANDFGNLVSRALTMAAKYCDGKLPPRPAAGAFAADETLRRLEDPATLAEFQSGVFRRYEALDFGGALAEIWTIVSQLNQRIVEFSPWTVAKDEGRRAELDAFLYRLLEAVRLLAVLASPVVPAAARRVGVMLGLPAGESTPAELAYGRLVPGQPLGSIEPLFPRHEKKKETSVPEDQKPAAATPAPPRTPATAPAASPADGRIDISEFAKVELRVAQVLAAEKVQGSKKLLRIQVDLGSEQRQVIAGIAQFYEPEALVGRKVVIVANLKPAKLMGLESNGMVLAASPDDRAVLLSVESDVPPGTKIR